MGWRCGSLLCSGPRLSRPRQPPGPPPTPHAGRFPPHSTPPHPTPPRAAPPTPPPTPHPPPPWLWSPASGQCPCRPAPVFLPGTTEGGPAQGSPGARRGLSTAEDWAGRAAGGRRPSRTRVPLHRGGRGGPGAGEPRRPRARPARPQGRAGRSQRAALRHCPHTAPHCPEAPERQPRPPGHPPTHPHTHTDSPPTPGTHPRALTPSTPPPPPHPTPPPPRTPGHPPPLPSPPATRGAPIPRQPTRWRSLPPGRRADARDVSRPAPFERLSAAENSDFPCGSQHNYSALLLQWLWLDPWPGNFHMPQVRPLVLRSRSPPRPAPGPFASPFAPARPLPSPASPEPTSRAPRPRPPAPRTPTHTRAPTRPPQPSPTLSHLAMLSLASSHRPTAAATCPKRRHRSAPRRRRRRRRRVPHGPVRASCPPRQARSPAGPAAHLCSPPTPHPHIPRGPTGP